MQISAALEFIIGCNNGDNTARMLRAVPEVVLEPEPRGGGHGLLDELEGVRDEADVERRRHG